MNGHEIGTYRDDWLTVIYCKKCKKEGIELAMIECFNKDREEIDDKKEKFVSGLPEWD